MALELSEGDGQDFRPPMFVQARACSAPYHNARSLPHPFGLANFAWGRVESTLRNVLDAFDAANTDGATDQAHKALLESHRQFVYANSEFFETILEKLPSCLVAPGTKLPKAEGAQKRRQHADKVCNILKHDQNRLVLKGARFGSLINVLGYSVMGHDEKGVLRPNPNVHKGEETSFSFGFDIRRILANTYYIGASVGALIEKHGQPFTDERPASTTQMRELLGRVAALPRYIFPWERPRDLPVFAFYGPKLIIRDHGGHGMRFSGTYTITVTMEGDGSTREFSIL